MALGFGFNKTKILSAAEKYVQQGKLQNAIAEYDKVAKQDPKDLTVLNTIGDLYARLGRGDQATEYFQKVGDAYASDGFVVKAIAMYKKLTKLHPSATDSIVRLAELYTQQGLYNDARAQYTAVADTYLKANEREKATGILKKMLDLDPDNAAMQTKVADLYLKLGKNKEALEIYFNSAQSLYQRAAIDSAEEALSRVLKLDANFAPALLLRGQIAAESGNNELAIENLSKLPDLDSRPEALRPLLQAYVQTGKFEQADPIADKLVAVHNDLSGVSTYAEALLNAGKPEQAMSLYERHADKFIGSNTQGLVESLTSAVSKAKESAPALQSILNLLQKTGAKGHDLHEVWELLAHASVQSGELQKAADLYRELSEAEPENPLHEQNYKQVIARMGKDAATRELSVEEGGQALMVDELETAPAVLQEYPREIADAINSALTDSELFSSYNVPDKAIPPLERVLPKAPNDVRVRQRLASLYARVGRFADAANCCTALADLYSVAGLNDQASQFREMAAKYNEQAAGAAPSAPVVDASVAPAASPASEMVAPGGPVEFQASSVAEFNIEAAADAPAIEQPTVAEFDLSAVSAESLPEAPLASAPIETPEVDQANEWEDMLTVEAPAAAGESTTQYIGGDQAQEVVSEESADEVLEEARFYLSQGMTAEAQSTIARLATIDPNHPALSELRSTLGLGESVAAPEIDVVSSEAPLSADAHAEQLIVDEATVTEFDLHAATSVEQETAAPEFGISAPATPAIEEQKPAAAVPEVVQEQALQEEPITAGAVESDDVLGDIGIDEEEEEAGLEDLVPEVGAGEPASLTPPPVPIPPTPVAPAPVSAPAMSAPVQPAAATNPLAGLVSDLEDVLGDMAPPPAAAKPAPSPASPPPPQPMAAAAPQMSAPASAPPPVAAPERVEVNHVEAHSMLSDLLDEFKEGMEEPAAEGDDDPDTHYNLGVAFREMGLLDEAIGELQKVCRALDNGIPFSQPIQAYTWLAQCLVDKGAAQAAVRWYEKALGVKGISDDSKLAVHYDMANAFEAAGNKKAALDNFMEVYGSNIDYRDVADRIRSLSK